MVPPPRTHTNDSVNACVGICSKYAEMAAETNQVLLEPGSDSFIITLRVPDIMWYVNFHEYISLALFAIMYVNMGAA